MIARHLIAAAYPIEHDEGCYLDPEFGEGNFRLYVDTELYDEDDEDFDPTAFKPFCNCGADELNKQAEEYLANTQIDETTILAAIEMVSGVRPSGLSETQRSTVELFRKHIIGNMRFMAGLPEKSSEPESA